MKIAPRQLVAALAVAVLATLVLSARVSVAFEPRRVKVVEAPINANNSAVRVDLDSRRALPAAPVAIIARIRNQSANAQQFTVSVNGEQICGLAVDGLSTKRVDGVFSRNPVGTLPTHVEVRSVENAWQLAYLEVATHISCSLLCR